MLRFPNKQIRSSVIADFVQRAGYRGCVCFSCGNASDALKNQGLYVLDVAPKGGLSANTWWTVDEIHKSWPDLFDATSGHLPTPLLNRIASAFKTFLGILPEQRYEVPTGSGETIVCLKLAYPNTNFVPTYNLDEATKYNPQAPLNNLVEILTGTKSPT